MNIAFFKLKIHQVLIKISNILDPTVDRIKSSAIPILKTFLAGDNEVILTVEKRGVAPLGGGQIRFKCPASRYLKTIQVSLVTQYFIGLFLFFLLELMYTQIVTF